MLAPLAVVAFALPATAATDAEVHGVVLAAGAPVAGVSVAVTGPVGLDSWTASTTTAADGTYSIPGIPQSDLIPSLRYRVTFTPPVGSRLLGASVDIYLSTGESATVDRSLVQLVTVRGTITDTSATPLAGATVTVGGSVDFPTQSTTTAADGTYVVDAAAGTRTVAARQANSATVQATATVDVVPPGDVVVNLTLPRGAWIGGVVTDDGGGPLAGVTVTVTHDVVDTWMNEDDPVDVTTTTAADGTYEVVGLPDESYRLHFITAAGDPHASAWYDDAAIGNAGTSGAWIPIASGDARPGTDVALPRRGALRGTVTGIGGVPIAGAEVRLYHELAWYWGWITFAPSHVATTDALGRYDFGPIDPGPWEVWFEPPAGAPEMEEYWHDSYPPYGVQWLYDLDPWTAEAPMPSRPRPPSVLVGPTGSVIDEQLAEGASVEGRLVGPHGTVPPNGIVTATEDHGPGVLTAEEIHWDGETQAIATDGTFQIAGLLPHSGGYLIGIVAGPPGAAEGDARFEHYGPFGTTECFAYNAFCTTATTPVPGASAAPLWIRWSPACTTSPFVDVDWGELRCGSIRQALDDDVLRGYADHTFRPDAPTSRQAAVVSLWRWAGSPTVPLGATSPFFDVSATGKFRMAIEWAANAGILTGYPDGTFRPTEPMTRQALALVLWRGAGMPTGAPSAGYSDVPPIGTDIRTAADWLHASFVFAGNPDATFGPATVATRATLAEWLMWYPELP